MELQSLTAQVMCDRNASRLRPAGWIHAGVVILFISLGGCGKTAPTASEPAPTAQPASFRETSPKQFLHAVLSRYQNAASYHDRGVVKLRYQVDGRWETQAAPIQVWLDHDQLYVAAYDVRIWRDDQSLKCWILDPATNDFDSQVVRRNVTVGRPTLERLLSDPILADRMAAGLAGPPPQLDWLFSPAPMEPLFVEEHDFEFGSAQTIDGAECQSVIVDRQYVFWVDSSNSTIRRVELPSLRASAQPGQAPQAMNLTVELVGATFRADRKALQISPLPTEPKYVGQFVPLPPPRPAEALGSQLPAFRAPVQSRGWWLSQQGSDRELTMLIAFNGDAQSRLTAQTIDRWQANMPVALRERVRIGLLVDPPAASVIPESNSLAIILDDDQRISRLLTIQSGGLAIINQQGVVSWIQPGWATTESEPLITLGAVMGDLFAQVDVPKRLRQQWREQVATYQQALR